MREDDEGPDRNAPRSWLRGFVARFFPGQKVSDAPGGVWLWALFEAVLFCSAGIAVAFWLEPTDPFGLKHEFPWLWLISAGVAMRYGSVIGLAAVGTLFGGWFIFEEAQLIDAAFPKAYFLGGLILTLLAGQFADVWNSRQRRLRAVNAYLDERLNTLTRSHFLLRLSHERLEQDLLSRPLTLRETLVRLRALAALGGATTLPGADEFMQVLAQSCQLEVAAVYALRRDATIDTQPAARLGGAGALDLSDPLLTYSLEQGDLVHVQMAEAGARDFDLSRYLVCAPMQTASGARVGLVAVERLPFFALNYETLQLFSVLLGYYADGVEAGQETRAVQARVPACPIEFALDLVRLTRIRNSADIHSAMVALVFEDNGRGADMYAQVKRLKRNMDLAWEPRVPGRLVVLSLLPLAGPAAVEGYLVRLEGALQSQFGAGFVASRVTTHVAHLGGATAEDTLAQLIERCHA